MIDLCWTCQQNSSIILKAVNKSTEEKSAASNAHIPLGLLLYTCTFRTAAIHMYNSIVNHNTTITLQLIKYIGIKTIHMKQIASH